MRNIDVNSIDRLIQYSTETWLKTKSVGELILKG